MRKIPTLFIRDPVTRLATSAVEPGCEWVLAGEGVASRKWDGTCCMIRDGKLYKRVEWDAQKGPAPASWLHHDFDPAQRSGHGWLPVGDGPEDWQHREGWKNTWSETALARGLGWISGTYELVGPRIGKNPENVTQPMLLEHGAAVYEVPRSFDGIRDWLATHEMEGVVFAHRDGRMCKIKRVDFGFSRAGKREKVKP